MFSKIVTKLMTYDHKVELLLVLLEAIASSTKNEVDDKLVKKLKKALSTPMIDG